MIASAAARATGPSVLPRSGFPAACLLGLLTAGCGAGDDPGARPDVLLVVVDTLRQDRVGAYGYPLDTTPHLDALAARGTLYSEARSTAGWTSPAHASIFTGLYAAAHGSTQEQWDLRRDLTTLAEILRAAGYRTLAGVGNPMLAADRGFAQGFEAYRESWRGRPPDAEPPTDAVTLAWLADRLHRRDQRPQFVFVNLIGIHNPYDSCGSHCGEFGAALEDGPTGNEWQEHYLGRVRHDRAGLERISRLYDAEVRQADDMLGAAVAEFEAAAAGRPALIILTSDHGENLGEHGHIDHAFSIHETIVRVPLAVLAPGVTAGAVDPSPVQLHDLFPTVLQAAGLDPLDHPSQGLPLDRVPDDRPPLMEYYRPIQASRSLAEKAVPSELPRLAPWQRRLRSVVAGGDKLIRGSDGLRELYDLGEDPREVRDLAGDPGAAGEIARLEAILLSRLEVVAREQPDRRRPEVDEETRRALEALGYVQ